MNCSKCGAELGESNPMGICDNCDDDCCCFCSENGFCADCIAEDEEE